MLSFSRAAFSLRRRSCDILFLHGIELVISTLWLGPVQCFPTGPGRIYLATRSDAPIYGYVRLGHSATLFFGLIGRCLHVGQAKDALPSKVDGSMEPSIKPTGPINGPR